MYKPQDITSQSLLAGFLRCDVDSIPILKSKLGSVLEMSIPKRNPRYGYRKVHKASRCLLSNTLKHLHFELNKIYVPQLCVGGFVRGRGISYNATPHINKKVILNIDIKDFFESIPFERIVSTFIQYGFIPEIANDITEIVTYNRILVAGFNTSPIIANMCCEEMDAKLLALCSAGQIDYTRYADDLSFSGENISVECIENIKAIIAQYGFIINDKKTRIYRKGGPQYVTGLTVVDDKYPRIPKRIKRELRSDIYYIVKYGLGSHIKYKYHIGVLDRCHMGDLCLDEARKIVGWIHFINSIEPMVAKHLNEILSNMRYEDLGYFINAYGYIENLHDLK